LNKNFIPEVLIREQVRAALAEDVGNGDRTAGLIPQDSRSEVNVICRDEAVLCGIAWFNEVFHQLLPDMEIEWYASDGDDIAPGSLVCRFAGGTRGLLTGERTALNYLQTLSGTATLARRYAHRVAGTGVRILDTRKTIPGLRLQQKYAVSCGGCYNHRIGLFDAILIKENHIHAAGSIEAALSAGLQAAQGLEVEIEVESMDELQQALDAGAGRVLLDNFDLGGLREAVALNAGRARLEASGNVNLDTVLAIAETGVDDISVGSLTKDVTAVDFSMRFS
jgi:nicotinate-nucleotide pyrophosphorylase (carboxylating)